LTNIVFPGILNVTGNFCVSWGSVFKHIQALPEIN